MICYDANTAQMLDQPDQWALFNHDPASTYYKGSVALLGDAAHATTPHQGSGAGQAVEDAAFLAVLLEKTLLTGSSFATTFQVYDAIRRPRSQRVVTTSKAAGDTYAFRGPGGSDCGLIAEELLQRFDWIWDYKVAEQCEVAAGLLQADNREEQKVNGVGVQAEGVEMQTGRSGERPRL